MLANVLHDWEDQRATTILRNCRQAMARGGRVLIVERLIPEEPGDAVPTLLSDINMLVITGGQERTNAEYASLLAGAGLTDRHRAARCVPLRHHRRTQRLTASPTQPPAGNRRLAPGTPGRAGGGHVDPLRHRMARAQTAAMRPFG